jgi:hypothetical protein
MESITVIALENSRRQLTGECEKDVLQTLLNLFAEARKNESIFHTVCRIVPHDASLREDEEKLDADIASLLAELIEAGKASNQLSPALESDVLVPLLRSTLTATAHEWAANPDNFNPYSPNHASIEPPSHQAIQSTTSWVTRLPDTAQR